MRAIPDANDATAIQASQMEQTAAQGYPVIRVMVEGREHRYRDEIAKFIGKRIGLALHPGGAAGGDPDIIALLLPHFWFGSVGKVRRVRKRHPGIPVLVISGGCRVSDAARALGAGARGYMMDTEVGRMLEVALQMLAAGEIYVSESLSTPLIEQAIRATIVTGPGRSIAAMPGKPGHPHLGQQRDRQSAAAASAKITIGRIGS